MIRPLIDWTQLSEEMLESLDAIYRQSDILLDPSRARDEVGLFRVMMHSSVKNRKGVWDFPEDEVVEVVERSGGLLIQQLSRPLVDTSQLSPGLMEALDSFLGHFPTEEQQDSDSVPLQLMVMCMEDIRDRRKRKVLDSGDHYLLGVVTESGSSKLVVDNLSADQRNFSEVLASGPYLGELDRLLGKDWDLDYVMVDYRNASDGLRAFLNSSEAHHLGYAPIEFAICYWLDHPHMNFFSWVNPEEVAVGQDFLDEVVPEEKWVMTKFGLAKRKEED